MTDVALPPGYTVDTSVELPKGYTIAQGGVARNVGAGANETLTSILGAPVDAASWLINKVTSPFTGTADNEYGEPTKLQAPPDIKQPAAPQPLIQNPIGGSESLKTGLGYVGADPRDVGVNDTADKYARVFGNTAAGMAIPGVGAEALAPTTAGMLRTGLATATNAGIGGTAGVAGQAAEDQLPENSPWRPLVNTAAQLVAGGGVAGALAAAKAGVNYGVNAGRNIFAPNSEAGRAAIVGQQLRDAATNPGVENYSLPGGRTALLSTGDPTSLEATLDQRQELVPGSQPTTFQLTGDQGIGQQERAQATQNPAPFNIRRGEQNAARVGALNAVAPDANTGAVQDLLRQRLDQIDRDGDAMVQAAQNSAQARLDAAGGQVGQQELGGQMRQQLEAAKAQTKKSESALWNAIDPDGKLTINGTPITQAANQIASEIPKTAAPQAGEEAAVFNATKLLGTNSPFSDVTALRGRLLSAIRTEAATNGQSAAWRRMNLLRGSIDDTMSALTADAAGADPGLAARLAGREGYGSGQQAATAQAGRQGGGYGNDLPQPVPGVAPSGNPGAAGTGGYQGERPGGAAGYTSLPEEAQRPQDIIQFLQDRGGVKDFGGELRSMDANLINKGYFGRLSNSNGMELDHAREVAAEAGYINPNGDINDLLNAINDTYHGNPAFSTRDSTQAAEWRQYEDARKSGAFEPQEPPAVGPMPHTPSGPWDAATDLPPWEAGAANWDAAAQARYRAAADATRERAQTYNNQYVGPALQEKGGMYAAGESGLPSRFIASPEAAQAYIKAGGDPETLKTALVADLRNQPGAVTQDGTLNPRAFASWQLRRQGVLKSFPDLQASLGNAAQAQTALDQVTAQTRQASLDYQRGAARHFLNAEPTQAVGAALGGKNPIADTAELSRLVSSDPDAKAGLQRAFAEYIQKRFIGNTEVGSSGVAGMKSDAFQTFLKTKGEALSKVFNPDQMASMQAIADDLVRSNRSIVSSKLPAQSNTAQDLNALSKMSILKGYMSKGATSALGGVAGYLFGGLRGAIEGVGGATILKGAIDKMRAAGLEKTDDLMTEALLNPDLAKTLLMTAKPANRPFFAQRLGQQLGALAVSAGAHNATQH